MLIWKNARVTQGIIRAGSSSGLGGTECMGERAIVTLMVRLKPVWNAAVYVTA